MSSLSLLNVYNNSTRACSIDVIFYTSDIQTVTECQLICGFELTNVIIADKSKIFLINYDSGNNLLFKLSRSSYIDFVTIRCLFDPSHR